MMHHPAAAAATAAPAPGGRCEQYHELRINAALELHQIIYLVLITIIPPLPGCVVFFCCCFHCLFRLPSSHLSLLDVYIRPFSPACLLHPKIVRTGTWYLVRINITIKSNSDPGSHTAVGSYPLSSHASLIHHYSAKVRNLHFHREKTAALFPLVDSRRVPPASTHACEYPR